VIRYPFGKLASYANIALKGHRSSSTFLFGYSDLINRSKASKSSINVVSIEEAFEGMIFKMDEYNIEEIFSLHDRNSNH
jgi:hypothetical protein